MPSTSAFTRRQADIPGDFPPVPPEGESKPPGNCLAVPGGCGLPFHRSRTQKRFVRNVAAALGGARNEVFDRGTEQEQEELRQKLSRRRGRMPTLAFREGTRAGDEGPELCRHLPMCNQPRRAEWAGKSSSVVKQGAPAAEEPMVTGTDLFPYLVPHSACSLAAGHSFRTAPGFGPSCC